MAELEMALPMYWNTLAKHLLYCRLPKQMELWGRMWAHNMLVFERMHVLLKGMVRSGKNMAASVANSYGAYCVSQSKNRFNKDLEWANDAKMSSLSCRPEINPSKGIVTPQGIKCDKKTLLSDLQYAQLITLWGTKVPGFKSLITRYLSSCGSDADTREGFLCNMHTWKPQTISESNAKMLKLNRQSTVVNRALLDGLEFRTTASQEKFKMDNSCIMSRYYDNTVPTRREYPSILSFGIIKGMFYHQMWPGSARKVVLDLDWYERVGDSPRNDLPQIVRNTNWDTQRLAFLEDCIAMNSVFWPSDPFGPETKDEDERLLDVILHHDSLPPDEVPA